MKDMIDTVAWAINVAWNAQGEVPFPLYQQEGEALARAAIKAMREPTETMRQAGADNLFAAASDDWKDDAGTIWSAMIDAALHRIDGKGE
jgi:hypothetical protein